VSVFPEIERCLIADHNMHPGASGIGALLVQAMAKKGAKVVVLDINRATETTGKRKTVSMYLEYQS